MGPPGRIDLMTHSTISGRPTTELYPFVSQNKVYSILLLLFQIMLISYIILLLYCCLSQHCQCDADMYYYLIKQLNSLYMVLFSFNQMVILVLMHNIAD